MGLRISLATVAWDGVVGATGYEIRVDNKPVATAGAQTRSARVKVAQSGPTEVTVTDLPSRTVEQYLQVTQSDGA